MIPFLDLRAQYEALKDEILPAVAGVFESTQFILGREVAAFEEEFADYCGTKHCVAVNTGTSSLHLALMALGIGPGDEVVTTPMTFVATAAAIAYTGATPVFADVDPRSYTLDPALIEARITPATKAILPVHLYGQCADMEPILAIAEKHGLPVIEDACQAHGARCNGRRAGSMGRAGCFSFYPGKNLGAFGEGGALTTDDDSLAEAARAMRDWGQKGKYNHVMPGFNYRMDGVQGAILRIKLRRLDAWTEARRENAAHYVRGLAGLDCTAPQTMPWADRHVFHVFPLLVADRAALGAALSAREIQNGIHYPTPVHLLGAYEHLGYKRGDFPVAESIADRELSLPMFAELTQEQIDTVCRAVGEALEGK